MDIPDIKLDFWTILFLVAGAQACFVSAMILVFNKQDKLKGNLYLSAFLFLFGYMLIFNFCYWTNYLYTFPALFYTIFPLNYVYGPLLLLYFDTQRSQPKYQKWWFLQGIPFLLVILHMSPFYILDDVTKLQVVTGEISYPKGLLWRYIGYMNTPMVFGSFMMGYFLWKIRLFFIIQKEDSLSDKSAELQLIRKRWFLLLLGLYAAFMFSYLVYFMIADEEFFTVSYDYAITAIMTLSIYALAYLGIRRKFIFSGEIHRKVFAKDKYANSSLSSSAVQAMVDKISQYMEQKKPFLDNELSLKSFAQQLGLSPHHLSQVINDNFGKTFNQYINEFRIKEAQRLLTSPEFAQDHIIQIAYQCGFNNKSTFNQAFKKSVGKTPSQFRKSIHPEKLKNP